MSLNFTVATEVDLLRQAKFQCRFISEVLARLGGVSDSLIRLFTYDFEKLNVAQLNWILDALIKAGNEATCPLKGDNMTQYALACSSLLDYKLRREGR